MNGMQDKKYLFMTSVKIYSKFDMKFDNMFLRLIKYLLSLYILCVSTVTFAEVHILNFDAKNSTTLAGSWEYYPKQLSLTGTLKEKPISVNLPASFLNITGQVSDHGVFKKQFSIPDHAVNQVLALEIPYQYGAYRLYIDHKLMVEIGTVGDRQQHQTVMSPKLINFVSSSKNIEVEIIFSSYQQIRGGLENPIYIGYDRQIRKDFYKNMILTIWVSGMLMMIALFMILFSIYRLSRGQQVLNLLYLGLFILCLSLRSFFAVPFTYTLFTSINWVLGTRLEYFLTELVCVFFLTYLRLALPNFVNRFVYQLLTLVIGLNILVTLTQQPIIFQNLFFKSFSLSILLFLNMLHGIYLLYRDNIKFSKVNAFAIFIVCCTFIHDYLLGLNVIHSVEIAFYTSCLYFILVTLQLSRDYAIQSDNVILYNQQLIKLNRTLDQKVIERTRTVVELNNKLQLQVQLDALTGAFNRYALNNEIQKRFERATKEHKNFAFFMLDVDYFKKYNDGYGHLKGDDVLKKLVETLRKELPKNGFIARYGGEEFAILIDDMNIEMAREFANQCLNAVIDLELEHLYRVDEKQVVSLSIGGAVLDSENTYSNIEMLMKTADQHLYQAKYKRSCVVVK